MRYVPIAQLEKRLRDRVKGEVRFDAAARALYARDAGNYRMIPYGVVLPLDEEDVRETVAACHDLGVPITSRGAGTSLAGQTCNTAVVIDFSRHMNRILEIDADRRVARVQPGVVLDHLREQARGHGLTFGPDPATHNRCTLGGMIGNNACGSHAQMAGCVAENVLSLRVLTVDGHTLELGPMSQAEVDAAQQAGGRWGEIVRQLLALRETVTPLVRERYPDIPRRISGYNLDQLLPEKGFNLARAVVGSEGTCVVVLDATLRLVDDPRARSLVVVGFDDIAEAADAVPVVLRHSRPIALEAVDELLVQYMRTKGMHIDDLHLMPDAPAFLMVEFGGDSYDDANAQAERLMAFMEEQPGVRDVRHCDEPDHMARVWALRESGLGATARVEGEPDTWPGWEDSAVDPERLGDYLRDLRKLMDHYGYKAALYGHFGQGCVHTRIPFDLKTAEGIARFRSFVEDAADLCVRYGGSLSGEHGDGQARGELLERMYGADLVEAFRRFKRVWDPPGLMNPGKVVDARPLDADLQLGTGYAPWEPKLQFGLMRDEGRLGRATERCVGVGECRREHGEGVMCPSYMATREEMHSTRGRAHLLNEMLRGEVITEGWRSKEVRESLDLCLACKGCKSDCPVNVDMAAYKAEFMSHHYKGRLRPLPAYTIGHIQLWARVASLAPKLANAVAASPLLAPLAKRLGGITPHRDMPLFAEETFRAWWKRRGGARMRSAQRRVILWPDTFHDHFHPDVAKAAVEVLEAAGCEVVVPQGEVCCGRPLYDYGLLGEARWYLRHVVRTLRQEIRQGTPVVGLEPSCVSVFRDELTNLLPRDEDAGRLSKQTKTLAEYLVAREDLDWPRLHAEAVVKTHCHQHAVMGDSADRTLLERVGVEAHFMENTCCGLAGSFGFEAAHYDVSMQVGERAYLPRVRGVPRETLLLADGFSCRTQAKQGAGREPLHLAQALHMALREGDRVGVGSLVRASEGPASVEAGRL